MLKELNIEYKVIMPEAKTKIIGGRRGLDRIINSLETYKEMPVFITKLRRVSDEIDPEVIWFSDDKSLYCVGRALEKSLTKSKTMMFIRGDIYRVSFLARQQQAEWSYGQETDIRQLPLEPELVY